MGEPSETTERREAQANRRDNLIQAGVDPDTFRDFEDYRLERGLSAAEATRRLIRAGMEDAEQNETLVSIVRGLILSGFVLVSFGAIEGDIALLAAGSISIGAGVAISRFGHEIARQLP